MTTKQSGTERLQFLEGGLLSARDLQDDVAYESRMRGLHVRVLHNTWGVARGFSVHFNQARDTVLVGPGIAYDCAGREIISSRSLALPLPLQAEHMGIDAEAWWFDLVIGYDDRVDERPRHNTGCFGDGVSMNEERPRWRWVFAGVTHGEMPEPELADGVRFGEEIPIARITLGAEWRISTLVFTYRRHAQGLVRPHIGSGNLPHGSVTVAGNLFSWSVQVDTSSAGFNQTPYYIASLEGHLLDALAKAGNEGEGFTEFVRRLLGPLVVIESPSRTGFRLRVSLAFSEVQGEDVVLAQFLNETLIRFAMSRPFSMPLPDGVNWIGVEPVEGCQPQISLDQLKWLSGLAFVNPSIAFSNLILHGAAISGTHGGRQS
jgi:hypothetical protein